MGAEAVRRCWRTEEKAEALGSGADDGGLAGGLEAAVGAVRVAVAAAAWRGA